MIKLITLTYIDFLISESLAVLTWFFICPKELITRYLLHETFPGDMCLNFTNPLEKALKGWQLGKK